VEVTVMSVSVDETIKALREHLAARQASLLGPDEKAMARTAMDHLEKVIREAGVPLEEFVREDKLAPYVERLKARVCDKYLEQLKIAWRFAFRDLCRKGLLALDYGLCVVPADEKDPHDFEKCERGFPEAVLSVFPRCIVPKCTAKAIKANAAVPDEIKKEYRQLIANVVECKRDSTRAVYWFIFRQISHDMKIKSFKRDLASEAGAERLMQYFIRMKYVRGAGVIMRIRTVFSILKRAGLMDNPFDLKKETPTGLKYVIDFHALPETSPKQKFLKHNGRRHTKVDGVLVECRLRDEDIGKIREYGNPQLKAWKKSPPEERERLFRESQENMIARTVLFHPPRPLELWSMNHGEWGPVEDDRNHEYAMLFNNGHEHRRKRRPDRVVPKTYIHELEALWELRRALFAGRGDVDLKESYSPGMRRAGVAMWANPRTGVRVSPMCLRRTLRAALLRMGINPARAKRATIYWIRKGHQTFARNQSGGQGDKFLSEQAGHSESIMKRHYDGPETMARANHLKKSLWGPLGVVPVTDVGPVGPAGPVAGAGPSAVQYLQGEELLAFAVELEKMGKADGQAPVEAGELQDRVRRAVLQIGLFTTFPEAGKVLDVDVRTLERWAEQGHIRVAHVEGRRYLLKAEVNKLAQSLSAEDAGKLMGLCGRQVRNLIRAGVLKGVISHGKKYLIPLASVREYMAGEKPRALAKAGPGARVVRPSEGRYLGHQGAGAA
jgi:hypothetical protein